MKKAIYNWSGGKDSALALYHLLNQNEYSIETLLTSVNGHHKRVSMHGVREELLEEQAKRLQIPLTKLILPEQPSMEEYETIMTATLDKLVANGCTYSVFGDIFLEDLKKYREDKLAQVGLKGVFPLWKRDTTELVHEFINLGFKTVLTCVKSELLDKSFAGRIIDKDFLNDLPKNVDPCGENGEFHTFVYDAPYFDTPIPIEIGETIFREYKAPKSADDTCNGTAPSNMGFYFTDLKLKV